MLIKMIITMRFHSCYKEFRSTVRIDDYREMYWCSAAKSPKYEVKEKFFPKYRHLKIDLGTIAHYYLTAL